MFPSYTLHEDTTCIRPLHYPRPHTVPLTISVPGPAHKGLEKKNNVSLRKLINQQKLPLSASRPKSRFIRFHQIDLFYKQVSGLSLLPESLLYSYAFSSYTEQNTSKNNLNFKAVYSDHCYTAELPPTYLFLPVNTWTAPAEVIVPKPTQEFHCLQDGNISPWTQQPYATTLLPPPTLPNPCPSPARDTMIPLRWKLRISTCSMRNFLTMVSCGNAALKSQHIFLYTCSPLTQSHKHSFPSPSDQGVIPTI